MFQAEAALLAWSQDEDDTQQTHSHLTQHTGNVREK